ncbi:MAG: rRNA maturation RNase YbeY [Candidatus Pacebacteria bacterium]|jgi:probable rRNA maturation factor|nr:rRNA maturation RNase YbeY [Parcubacteria group bacterium]MDP6249298.1 rRNA maturation RNase YbeY [Candidatus Paceibacterota bacterium]MDP7159408.1 rRNA maturation RNase YbeY [Candidatus Paceibacterota bacterium]MDP7367222.1 rRNA maturation RNase YbeY [Candidatus Paceibacterota bacterium]MDP7466479.1 rRNA maturation RNase YbeY [Candidatus Paceibacterota bacterium]|tara:strand:+ start:421 stop:804 length:384 start_codon:yes stop_codon:yes gene_type:complete
MDNNFSIFKTIKGKPTGLPFENMKTAVLGKNYELSLVFIGSKKSQTLNKKYRKKDKPTNILSFPLSKTTGEIFICPETAKKDAKKFNMKEREFIGYLFIHGLMHLKGLRHSSTMERAEKKVRLKFSI